MARSFKTYFKGAHMTIASAFNDIAVAQGGTAAKGGTITAAIDALNDALAGSDQPQAKTIEQAVRLLGEHIGGGGGVTVEPLSVTENNVYTAPDGKAYSPVTVNVPSTPTEYNVNTYSNGQTVASIVYAAQYNGEFWVQDGATPIEKANAGSMLLINVSDLTNFDSLVYKLGEDFPYLPFSNQYTSDESITFVMPAGDVGAIVVATE